MSRPDVRLADALGQLDDLMRCERLARPAHPFVQPEDPRRDPSPLWDAWYGDLSVRERRELLPFMAPAGGGITLDQLAGELFCSVETALECWRGACQGIRQARRTAQTLAESLQDPSSDAYAEEWEAWDAEQMRRSALAIYGPQELAKDLNVTPAVIHQWRRRGKLPNADLVVSGVPLWHVDTLKGQGIL